MLDKIKQSKRHLNTCPKTLVSSKWETCTHTKCAKHYWKNDSLPHTVFSFHGCFWIKQSSRKYPVLWACLMAAKLCPGDSSSSLHSDCTILSRLHHKMYSACPKQPHTVLTSGYQTFHFICQERLIPFLSLVRPYPGLPSELHISEQHKNSSHASFTPAGKQTLGTEVNSGTWWKKYHKMRTHLSYCLRRIWGGRRWGGGYCFFAWCLKWNAGLCCRIHSQGTATKVPDIPVHQSGLSQKISVKVTQSYSVLPLPSS